VRYAVARRITKSTRGRQRFRVVATR